MKHKKSGFTLVELLVVIAIIAMIGTVSVVIIEGVLKKSNNDISMIEEKNIISSAKAYATDNLVDINDNIENFGSYLLSYNDLIIDGIIDSDEQKDMFIKITRNGNRYEYQLIKSNVTDTSKLLRNKIRGVNNANGITLISSSLVKQENDYLKSINGFPTYYYKGNTINNNYVRFAGITWRIMRINENGSIRLVAPSTEGVVVTGSEDYFNNANHSLIGWWIDSNFNNESFNSKIVSSYFCNNVYESEFTSDIASFVCSNEDSVVHSKIGTITADDLIFATNTTPYFTTDENICYATTSLYNGYFYFYYNGNLSNVMIESMTTDFKFLPVINLRSDVTVTGSGTSGNPYVIEN